MRYFTTLLFLCLFSTLLFSQNQIPVIVNPMLEVNTTTQQLVINYDLEDAEGDLVEISFQISENGGKIYSTQTIGLSGDIGSPISQGTGKQFTWDYTQVSTDVSALWVRVIADDKQEVDIQALVNQVDSNRLRGDMTFFEGRRHRSTGTTLLRATKDSLEELFTQQNLEVNRQAFDYNGYEAHNIIGRKTGVQDAGRVYILDGHYDTVSGSPGADDNATGFTGMMEACRILAPYDFNYTIKFIGFDLEEEGLVGSNRYVTNGGIAPFEQLKGVINFEMIGYFDSTANSQTFPAGFNLLYPDVWTEVQNNGSRGDFITNVGNINSSQLTSTFDIAAARYVPELSVISILADAPGFTPLDLLRSDHASFWLGGYEALMITDGANFRNPNYHSPNDRVEHLNFHFMANVVKTAVATLAELAEIKHSSSWTYQIDPSSSIQELNCSFSTFPNPNDQFLKIVFDNCHERPTSIQVLNLQGQQVFQGPFPNSNDFQLSTQHWPSGLYLLQLMKGDKVSTQKFMVSH